MTTIGRQPHGGEVDRLLDAVHRDPAHPATACWTWSGVWLGEIAATTWLGMPTSVIPLLISLNTDRDIPADVHLKNTCGHASCISPFHYRVKSL
jgi:hypothetical protein